MSQQTMDERKLTELHPARRNRFYYGKLMDVLHCSMEQQYVLSKEWLYNREVLGPGVVCGLVVEPLTTEAGHGIVIRSGFAIDWWGREIVVPEDVALVPLVLTDPCGAPLTDEELPANVTVQVCYDECLTDFAPMLVSDDCGCDGAGCEAGTLVETYCVRIREGEADPVDEPCLDNVMAGLKSGELHSVLCALTASCASPPDDPCLTLANVKVADDGTLTVDSCTPRTIAPSNQVLMQLIRCLADCCKNGGPPPPKHPLQVTAVRVLRRGEQPPDAPNLPVIAELQPPAKTVVAPFSDSPSIVEVQFDLAMAYDPATAILGQSFLVGPASGLDKLITTVPGNVVRLYRQRGFRKGKYKFTLVGDPGGAGPSAIQAVDGTRLDGEFPGAGGVGWHSGDGSEGGDFVFILVVK